MNAPSRILLATVCLFALPLSAFGAHAATTHIIYSFAGGVDGEYADTDLVRDASGNLYGSTVQGGDHASGTVWQLHPNGDGTWTHTVLYSFTGGSDGGEPYKGVTLDATGNLFGTAVTGGSGACEGGCGVAYEVANNGGTWTQSVIHAFAGAADGSGPGAGLTVGPDGALYGMAPTGGADGAGTVYRMWQQSGAWQFAVIHTFTGGEDGAGGSAGRLLFNGLNLYGAATSGGRYGGGVVYELSPLASGPWPLRVLYAFKGDPDVSFPYGGLMFDGTGNLYGTAYYDGEFDAGGVYQLTPKRRGAWKERVLYDFHGGTDGGSSIANLVSDSAGNLYGTTSAGGFGGQGVIFRLMPKDSGRWKEKVMHDFTGTPDGAFPYNGMVGDGAGHFFGATTQGGAHDEGAIYEFTP